MNVRTTPSPFVKWVGGKRSLLKEIHARLPESFNNYFEPFVGGGAVFFSLVDRIQQAILVDKNIELVTAYQSIKTEPLALIELLRVHAEKHSRDYYYQVRKEKPSKPLEKAARFLYLNRTGYNGLYRVNKSGGFNVPIGNYKHPNIVNEETILACHEALKKAHIKYGDFSSIRPFVQRGDFVYCDPPYHPTTELSFTKYTKEDFTESNQRELRDFALDLHKVGAHVMLSNSNTPFIRELYSSSKFHQQIVLAPRFVNCKPGERDAVEELLITNY